MKIKTLLILVILGIGFTHAQSKSVVKTKNSTSNTNISISTTNDKFSFNALFDKEKTENVKKTIVKTLGNAQESSDKYAMWKGNGYSITIKQGKVEMESDKNKTTKSTQIKLEDLGNQISETLESHKTPEPPKPSKN